MVVICGIVYHPLKEVRVNLILNFYVKHRPVLPRHAQVQDCLLAEFVVRIPFPVTILHNICNLRMFWQDNVQHVNELPFVFRVGIDRFESRILAKIDEYPSQRISLWNFSFFCFHNFYKLRT